MTDNKFLISDASYSYFSKCAGLGVVDLYSNKKYSQAIENVKNISSAEYRALLLSVQIALKNKYDNVVFVYDHKGLNISELKVYLKDKIENYQFLWLKRVYVHEADALAKKARKLKRKLGIQNSVTCTNKTADSKNSDIHLKGASLVNAIKNKPLNEIIDFCSIIGSKKDKKLLDGYFNSKKTEPYNLNYNGLKLFMLIHFMLEEDQKNNFFLFIKNKIKGKKLKRRFLKVHTMNFYITMVHEVVNRRKVK